MSLSIGIALYEQQGINRTLQWALVTNPTPNNPTSMLYEVSRIPRTNQWVFNSRPASLNTSANILGVVMLPPVAIALTSAMFHDVMTKQPTFSANKFSGMAYASDAWVTDVVGYLSEKRYILLPFPVSELFIHMKLKIDILCSMRTPGSYCHPPVIKLAF